MQINLNKIKATESELPKPFQSKIVSITVIKQLESITLPCTVASSTSVTRRVLSENAYVIYGKIVVI